MVSSDAEIAIQSGLTLNRQVCVLFTQSPETCGPVRILPESIGFVIQREFGEQRFQTTCGEYEFDFGRYTRQCKRQSRREHTPSCVQQHSEALGADVFQIL